MVDKVLALPAQSKHMLLAPVVRNRKGEHANLASFHAQGFIRARIDGDNTTSPSTKLDLHKHTIEIVIDRFKVRPELQQRLADPGNRSKWHKTAYVQSMDNPKGDPLVFAAPLPVHIVAMP